ncbi:MAG: protein-disulfide reductase DsbD [Gammaproteobacteria bacterium]|nr:protein-disulfide reductase DsbD [Gammaproteobacteria bacterium]
MAATGSLTSRWTLVVALAFGAAPAAAAGERSWLLEEPEFLPVDEAFALSTETADDGALLAYWDMPQGYYLYRHRFDFTLRNPEAAVLGPAELPPGKAKVDEYFGAVEVYYHRAQARVPIRNAQGPVEVGISYQGCAEAGLCYPPERRWVLVDAAVAPPVGPAAPPIAESAPRSGAYATQEQRLARALAERGLLLAMALFFIGGVGLAFTPCVLPMVPILSSIIVGDAQTPTRWRAFSLSLAYVLGMAFTYAGVGTLMGLFGASLNLQAALQSPPVLIVFAALFVGLSLAMFGFYELRLPQRWQNSLDALGGRLGGGKHLGVLVMGALSALVVSPCVSAPLAGALIYISASQDAVLGAAALLALGLGMGVPLLVIGSSGGHLLPRAGAWMNAVKAVFGVGLLAVAVWLLERVVPGPASLALWAALLIGSSAYLGGLDTSASAGWGKLRKAAGFAAAIYGALLLIGAASGANDPLRPLQHFATVPPSEGGGELQWRPVGSLEDVQAGIDAGVGAGRLTLLDLYADWCISCKVMERSVFPVPEVASRLAEFQLLRADVTANDAQDQALLNAFGLFGPPSLVFFDRNGRELKSLRVQGEIGAQALAEHLETVLRSWGGGEGDFVQNSVNFSDLAGI